MSRDGVQFEAMGTSVELEPQQVVACRLPADEIFADTGLLDAIIEKSGGYLRDLFMLSYLPN